ncbi:STN domain-containing protein, partial [Acinetobacter baumannii]
NSPGVSGTLPTSDALGRLLSGSGLSYRFTNAGTVTIERAGAAAAAEMPAGAIQLDTVHVSGGRVSAIDAPYSTPAPVSHISQETIER